MAPTIIPDDIAYAIVDFLGPDITTLASTALISRAFRFPCQKRLFHTIHLCSCGCHSGDSAGYAKTKQLLQNAFLQCHVREFSLMLGCARKPVLQKEFDSVEIEEVLPLLVNLTSFELSYLPGEGKDWYNVESCFKSFLLDVCLAPGSQISSLTLMRIWNLPFQVFATCPALKHLNLSEVRLLDLCDKEGVLNVPAAAMTRPKSPPTLIRLRSLVLRAYGFPFLNFASHLRQLSTETLERLALDLTPSWACPNEPLQPVSLPPNIRTLFFWVQGGEDMHVNSAEFQSVVRHLAASPHENLREVIFAIIVTCYTPTSFQWSNFAWLKQLDETLAGPGSKYRSRVRLTLVVQQKVYREHIVYERSLANYYEYFRTDVPLLHESGMFRVLYETGSAHVFEEYL